LEVERVDFTHTGWFLFCPVYIAPNFENPRIICRYNLPWLHKIAVVIFKKLIIPLYVFKAQDLKQPILGNLTIRVKLIYGIRKLKKPITGFIKIDADAS